MVNYVETVPPEISNGHLFCSNNNKTILCLKRSEKYLVYAKTNQLKTAQCLRANGRLSPVYKSPQHIISLKPCIGSKPFWKIRKSPKFYAELSTQKL